MCHRLLPSARKNKISRCVRIICWDVYLCVPSWVEYSSYCLTMSKIKKRIYREKKKGESITQFPVKSNKDCVAKSNISLFGPHSERYEIPNCRIEMSECLQQKEKHNRNNPDTKRTANSYKSHREHFGRFDSLFSTVLFFLFTFVGSLLCAFRIKSN